MLTDVSKFLQVHSSKEDATATVLKESCYPDFVIENVYRYTESKLDSFGFI
jgi:hypothetical protein